MRVGQRHLRIAARRSDKADLGYLVVPLHTALRSLAPDAESDRSLARPAEKPDPRTAGLVNSKLFL